MEPIYQKNYSRHELIEALDKRYNSGLGYRHWHFLHKKYAWLIIVTSTKFIKRTMDVIVSLSMLLVLSPLLILVGILVKARDSGPIFFNQTRIGKWGREFSAYKFRSMVMDAEKQVEAIVHLSHHEDSISYKVKKDPRVTWIGRIIRKASIDELPQLLNVLKGDMSLVGPRPHVQREVDQYTLKDRRRLDVLPGITCIWQVSGRADIPFPEQLKLDVKYIESQSFWTDVKILFLTIPAVLFAKGAY
jgi:lipopolysaccharide/colanic/teichoic acid biosynthesis glycosyltransferase